MVAVSARFRAVSTMFSLSAKSERGRRQVATVRMPEKPGSVGGKSFRETLFRYENKRLTINLHNLILIDTLWPLNEVDLTSNQGCSVSPFYFSKTAGDATVRLAALRAMAPTCSTIGGTTSDW